MVITEAIPLLQTIFRGRMDIRLCQDTGDAVFINKSLSREDLDTLSVATVLDKPETVSQRLVIQLKSFLTDWFLDTTYGVPYLQEILGRKGVRKGYIDNIIRGEIMKESGVREITYFNSTLSSKRVYELSFRVKTSDNSISEIIKLDKLL